VVNASVTPAMLRDTIKYTPYILTLSQFFPFKMAQNQWYEGISEDNNKVLMQHSMNSNSFFCGEGPRSRSYRCTAALRLLVQPCNEDERKMISFFSFVQVMEHRWNETDRGKLKYSGEKPVPVPLCPPQIPHGLTRDQTRAFAVGGGQRLTA
jgi:hypothetical protein